MALLTDQIFATGVTSNDLIHIVITGDTSQNPAGSSFKASIGQVISLVTGFTGTSGTSGTSGSSGISGTSGTDGSSGSSGLSGIDGALSGRWIFDSTYIPPSIPVTTDGYFYADNTTFSLITEFILDSVGENSVDYTSLLYKLSINTGVTVTITDVTNNSILGSWDIQTIVYNVNDTRFVVSYPPLVANSSLNPSLSYSISFSINGTNGTSGSSGTSGTNGTSGSSGTSPVSPFPYVYGLFSQTGNSVTVSGTTSETTIIGNGVGTLTVPANGFSVGDSFTIKMFGDLGSQNNDTIQIKIKSGSVILGDTGLITMPSISDNHFMLDVGFTIRSTGTTGNASILSSGFFTFIQDSSNNYDAQGFTTVNNTTFDTTSSNTLDITAQFSSINASNFIYSEFLVLNKVY